MSNVVSLPTRGEMLLTKKQLASHLGRSERWVELKVRDGLPVCDATDRFGRRRYSLTAVEDWLRGAKPRSRRPSIEDRVRDLEQQVRELQRRSG